MTIIIGGILILVAVILGVIHWLCDKPDCMLASIICFIIGVLCLLIGGTYNIQAKVFETTYTAENVYYKVATEECRNKVYLDEIIKEQGKEDVYVFELGLKTYRFTESEFEKKIGKDSTHATFFITWFYAIGYDESGEYGFKYKTYSQSFDKDFDLENAFQRVLGLFNSYDKKGDVRNYDSNGFTNTYYSSRFMDLHYGAFGYSSGVNLKLDIKETDIRDYEYELLSEHFNGKKEPELESEIETQSEEAKINHNVNWIIISLIAFIVLNLCIIIIIRKHLINTKSSLDKDCPYKTLCETIVWEGKNCSIPYYREKDCYTECFNRILKEELKLGSVEAQDYLSEAIKAKDYSKD